MQATLEKAFEVISEFSPDDFARLNDWLEEKKNENSDEPHVQPTVIVMPNKTLEDYRHGAASAVMDEYERAAADLKSAAQNVGAENYVRIADAETANEDCRSARTIVNHVVRSGFAYANYIRAQISMNAAPIEPPNVAYEELAAETDKMLAYTAEIFAGRWETAEDQIFGVIINTRWGLTYNVDQLLEHAIVHVLRHRRQIDKFALQFAAEDEK